MTTRLISSFDVVDGANDAIITYSGSDYTVTIPTGTYWWSCDGAASDFADILATAINTALAGPGSAFTCAVCGVDGTSAAAHAAGRVVLDDGYDEDWTWKTDDAGWTLDARILGEVPGTAPSAADNPKTSPHVHRYGWYPPTVPMELVTHRVPRVSSSRYNNEVVDGHCWTDENGILMISLYFDLLSPVFVRIDAAADADYEPASWLLTTGDLNCAWERFALDVSSDPRSRRWRCYRDADDETTYTGPFFWPDRHPLLEDPLATSRVRMPAGERRDLTIVGAYSP